MRSKYLAIALAILFASGLAAPGSAWALEEIFITDPNSNDHYPSSGNVHVIGTSDWSPWPIDYVPDTVRLRTYRSDHTMTDERGATFNVSTGAWWGDVAAPIGDPVGSTRFEVMATLYSGGSSSSLAETYVSPWVDEQGGGS